MKAVVISTHGFAVFEGTIIACEAFVNSALKMGSSYSFIYDDKGVLVEAKEASYNPVRDLIMKNED